MNKLFILISSYAYLSSYTHFLSLKSTMNVLNTQHLQIQFILGDILNILHNYIRIYYLFSNFIAVCTRLVKLGLLEVLFTSSDS